MMLSHPTVRVYGSIFLAGVIGALPAAVDAAEDGPRAPDGLRAADRGLALIEPGPTELSVLYADGSQVEIETETVWRFMNGSDTANASIEDLRLAVVAAREAAKASPGTTLLAAGGTRSGLDIVWNIIGTIPQEAEDALETAALYLEGQFDDPVTVTIDVRMYDFGNPNVIGSTGSSYVNGIAWSTVRSGMINGMDPDDTIHDYLPAGSTIPVRYNASTSTVTNESRCFFTRANYNATIGSAGGSAANMQFNTGFAFDYDPSDGVLGSRICFQSVVVHEVGHALGFTSGVDFRTTDIEALDIFRFQRTDGTGDYNPDTLEEFQTTPRTIDFNNLDDDVNSDLIIVEYRMSDGDYYQASHFRHQYPAIGIMAPAIGYGATFYPDFLRSSDLAMFDAIGWDNVDCNLNGSPDPEDVASGLSEDCNGNVIPDECEILEGSVPGETTYCTAACDPDCNENAVPDECDIAGGTSPDDDESGVPDECEVAMAPAMPEWPHNQKKNRYVSFIPNNGSRTVGFRVEMIAGPGPSGIVGWVGQPYDPGCHNDDGSLKDPPEPCTGDAFARVVDSPVYRVWTEPIVHVGACEIAPVALYEIRATPDDILFGGGLLLETIDQPAPRYWADIVGAKVGTLWQPPDGLVNVNDIQAAIATFKEKPTAPHVTWVDLAGETPNGFVNVTDAQMIILAFQDRTYPFSDPADCP